MSSKRKSSALGLERRVRPRREDEWEPEPDVSNGPSDEEEEDSDEGASEEGISGDEDQDGSGSDSSQDSEPEDEPSGSKVDIASISFGALAKAQTSLPPSAKKRKRSGDQPDEEEEPKDDDDADEKSSKVSQKGRYAKPPKRSSKHAPQEQTSKRPVRRIRESVFLDNDAPQRAPARDPRFDSAINSGGSKFDEAKARKAYAFLEEYRDKELADLRAQAKKTKDPDQKERLKRQIMSMESRKKARKQKDQEDRLLEDHRKQEKEMVAQGKQPFYLKKSDQKKQLLTNRFEGMSKGQVDRAIERKRKKVAGKEKKELDTLQRVTDRRG